MCSCATHTLLSKFKILSRKLEEVWITGASPLKDASHPFACVAHLRFHLIVFKLSGITRKESPCSLRATCGCWFSTKKSSFSHPLAPSSRDEPAVKGGAEFITIMCILSLWYFPDLLIDLA